MVTQGGLHQLLARFESGFNAIIFLATSIASRVLHADQSWCNPPASVFNFFEQIGVLKARQNIDRFSVNYIISSCKVITQIGAKYSRGREICVQSLNKSRPNSVFIVSTTHYDLKHGLFAKHINVIDFAKF